MKLSMWMIANQLTDFSLDLNIRANAPQILRSARRAYSTNCVHVYQDGENVICSGEGDSIRIYNMSVAEGLEIVQGIFDFYEDWLESVERAIRSCNYQLIADLSYQVFRNPMTIMDGNNRLLGITRQYGEDALDSEWAYIYKYGYPSMNGMHQLQQIGGGTFWRHGLLSFSPAGNGNLSFGGLSYGMYCSDAYCGRLTLLEKDRPLNRGDWQLLDYLGAHLEPVIGSHFTRDMVRNINVFYQLLFQLPYEESDLEYQLRYHNWNRDDVFSLVILEAAEPGANMDILLNVVATHTSKCLVVRREGSILMLSNRDLSADSTMRLFLNSLQQGNPIKAGISLPCRGIENAGLLYKQATYALEEGKRDRPEKGIYDFFDFGVSYILESPSLSESVLAAMPVVYRLWKMQETNGAEQFQTLKAFLENERSISKTSEAMFTHRNTIIYRLKRISEFLDCDLDNPYIREYCRLSIQVLELYNKKHPKS